MRIARLVAMGMMLAMVGDPSDGRAFAGERADQREQPFQRADRSASCRASTFDGSTGRCPSRRTPAHHDGQPERFPSEEPDRSQRQQMDGSHPDCHGPIDAVGPGAWLRVVVRDWSGGRRNRDVRPRLRAGAGGGASSVAEARANVIGVSAIAAARRAWLAQRGTGMFNSFDVSSRAVRGMAI